MGCEEDTNDCGEESFGRNSVNCRGCCTEGNTSSPKCRKSVRFSEEVHALEDDTQDGRTEEVCACCQIDAGRSLTLEHGRPILIYELPEVKFDHTSTHKRDFGPKPLPSRELPPWHPLLKDRWKALKVPSENKSTYQRDFTPQSTGAQVQAPRKPVYLAPRQVRSATTTKYIEAYQPWKKTSKGPSKVTSICEHTLKTEKEKKEKERSREGPKEVILCRHDPVELHDPACEKHCYSTPLMCHVNEPRKCFNAVTLVPPDALLSSENGSNGKGFRSQTTPAGSSEPKGDFNTHTQRTLCKQSSSYDDGCNTGRVEETSEEHFEGHAQNNHGDGSEEGSSGQRFISNNTGNSDDQVCSNNYQGTSSKRHTDNLSKKSKSNCYSNNGFGPQSIDNGGTGKFPNNERDFLNERDYAHHPETKDYDRPNPSNDEEHGHVNRSRGSGNGNHFTVCESDRSIPSRNWWKVTGCKPEKLITTCKLEEVPHELTKPFCPKYLSLYKEDF